MQRRDLLVRRARPEADENIMQLVLPVRRDFDVNDGRHSVMVQDLQ